MKTILRNLSRLIAVLALLIVSSSLMTSIGGITQAHPRAERGEDSREESVVYPYPPLSGFERMDVIRQMTDRSAANLLAASNWSGGYKQAYYEGVSEGWYEAAVYLANYEAHPIP